MDLNGLLRYNFPRSKRAMIAGYIANLYFYFYQRHILHGYLHISKLYKACTALSIANYCTRYLKDRKEKKHILLCSIKKYLFLSFLVIKRS